MQERPQIAYGTYVSVWLSLLVLTGVTITAAGLQLGRWSILTAIVIAAVKGTLVLFQFMHLKYESALFKIALVIALLTLTFIMVLTFADTLFR